MHKGAYICEQKGVVLFFLLKNFTEENQSVTDDLINSSFVYKELHQELVQEAKNGADQNNNLYLSHIHGDTVSTQPARRRHSTDQLSSLPSNESSFRFQYNLLKPEGDAFSPNLGKNASLSRET